MPIELQIDYREAKLKDFFENYVFKDIDCNINVNNLDIGDIIISNSNKKIVIERKTLSDLYSSINDGRYKEQKIRLLSNYNPSSIVYLIEGCSTSFQEKKFKNFSSIIRGAIINSLFRDSIKIIKTDNIDESIEYIKNIVKKLHKNPEFFSEKKLEQIESENNYVNTVKIKKKDNNDPYNCNIIMLSHIPGVSIKISKMIIEKYGSLNKLITAFNSLENESDREVMLKDYSYEISNSKTRKIGPVISKRIYEYLVINT
tara:strand:+ start:394 stop:1167 length:774 start_codon:yes stop_codon:yes gene_type:complete